MNRTKGHYNLSKWYWPLERDVEADLMKIFLLFSSEDYPYKEVLDLMANRCLADRTNAWTDTGL